jgi:hypothetical protein
MIFHEYQFLILICFATHGWPVSFRKVRGLIVFFSILEVHYCAPGDSGLAREQLIGKLLGFCPDLI